MGKRRKERSNVAPSALASELIEQPSSIAFTTENTEATEKKRRVRRNDFSVLSVFSVVKSLAAKYFKNDGSAKSFGAGGCSAL